MSNCITTLCSHKNKHLLSKDAAKIIHQRSSNPSMMLNHHQIVRSMLVSKRCFQLRSNVICSFWCEQEVQFFYRVHKISCIMELAWISIFPRKGVSLPRFKNGRELKLLEGIKKKRNFRYFTACNFIVSTSTNIIKSVCYENIYLQSNYLPFSSQ